LGKEIATWRGDKESVSFVPLHELDEQPKLIKAGHMKDYQVRTFSPIRDMAINEVYIASRAFVSGVDV
jgi:SWI/SNF-related matrix-associated actin-dependent regulator of chromatin subfamily A member 5